MVDYTTALLEEIVKILSITYKYPRGTTLTSIIHLQLKQRTTRIDFLDSTRHQDVPIFNGVRDIIITRDVPVSRLIIYNMGPGGVYCDTNRDFGDRQADTPINSNSVWEIITDYPSITSINLVAAPEGNSDAKIRLTAIV